VVTSIDFCLNYSNTCLLTSVYKQHYVYIGLMRTSFVYTQPAKLRAKI